MRIRALVAACSSAGVLTFVCLSPILAQFPCSGGT